MNRLLNSKAHSYSLDSRLRVKTIALRLKIINSEWKLLLFRLKIARWWLVGLKTITHHDADWKLLTQSENYYSDWESLAQSENYLLFFRLKIIIRTESYYSESTKNFLLNSDNLIL